ncbi:MAG: winged helix-turn-helix transcriptional regulator [Muribaculaceae bacterium]
MTQLEKKFSDIEHCPVRHLLAHITSKWAILLLLILNEAGTLRYSELQRMVPDISPKVLSSTLKTLAAYDLVRRTIYATVPPKVEYTITDEGRVPAAILADLTRWARSHREAGGV